MRPTSRPSPTAGRTSRAAAAVALATALAACGSGPQDEAAGEYTAPDADLAASITYGVWDQNQVPAIEENIAAFNQIYPDIDVTVNITPFTEY